MSKVERQLPGRLPRIPLLIRLSMEAREAIQRAAERDGRTMSNFVAHYAEDMAWRILGRK